MTLGFYCFQQMLFGVTLLMLHYVFLDYCICLAQSFKGRMFWLEENSVQHQHNSLPGIFVVDIPKKKVL